MSKRRYQQCCRCVMDTTDLEIQFDNNGICNHCTQFFKKREELKKLGQLGEENLSKIISVIKNRGKNKKYDVLLGISGGVDSCYLAYVLKEMGVRTLLVHMDNGWNTNQAIENIESIAKIVGFDYQSYVLNWDEFKDIQLAFLKASVVEIETPTDVAIQGILHRIAAKNNIHYIISGGNINTEGILPKLWHYNAKDTKYFDFITKTFGSKKNISFPNFGVVTEMYFKFMKRISIIYLLNYLDYNKDEAIKTLENIGWKHYGGKHHESLFTKFVQSYVLPTKYNLDYRKATYSSQICSGQMSREEALELLKLPTYKAEEVEREKEYVAKKLSISKDELQRIIDLPPKYYYEYPNDEIKLNFIYNIYKKYIQKKE